MVRGRRKEKKFPSRRAGHPMVASIGQLLLDLRDALQRAQRCRWALQRLRYSDKRWQEIVRDVDPELRFALRPQMLDAIISHLQSVGKPVNRRTLARVLHLQAAGPLQRIRQTITLNLRSGN